MKLLVGISVPFVTRIHFVASTNFLEKFCSFHSNVDITEKNSKTDPYSNFKNKSFGNVRCIPHRLQRELGPIRAAAASFLALSFAFSLVAVANEMTLNSHQLLFNTQASPPGGVRKWLCYEQKLLPLASEVTNHYLDLRHNYLAHRAVANITEFPSAVNNWNSTIQKLVVTSVLSED